MKISHIKNNITPFLLVFFLTMKMAGLHVLTHANDSDYQLDCGICDYAITHNLTPSLNPDSHGFSIENTEFLVQREISKNYNFITSGIIATDQLFPRPPPFLL